MWQQQQQQQQHQGAFGGSHAPSAWFGGVPTQPQQPQQPQQYQQPSALFAGPKVEVRGKTNPLDALFGKRPAADPVFGAFQAPQPATAGPFGGFAAPAVPAPAAGPTPLSFVPPPIEFADFTGPTTTDLAAAPFAAFQPQAQPQRAFAPTQPPAVQLPAQPQQAFAPTQPPAVQLPAQPQQAFAPTQPPFQPSAVPPPHGSEQSVVQDTRPNLDSLIFKSFEGAFSGTASAVKPAAPAPRAQPAPKLATDAPAKKSGVDWSNMSIRSLLQGPGPGAGKPPAEPEATAFADFQGATGSASAALVPAPTAAVVPALVPALVPAVVAAPAVLPEVASSSSAVPGSAGFGDLAAPDVEFADFASADTTSFTAPAALSFGAAVPQLPAVDAAPKPAAVTERPQQSVVSADFAALAPSQPVEPPKPVANFDFAALAPSQPVEPPKPVAKSTAEQPVAEPEFTAFAEPEFTAFTQASFGALPESKPPRSPKPAPLNMSSFIAAAEPSAAAPAAVHAPRSAAAVPARDAAKQPAGVAAVQPVVKSAAVAAAAVQPAPVAKSSPPQRPAAVQATDASSALQSFVNQWRFDEAAAVHAHIQAGAQLATLRASYQRAKEADDLDLALKIRNQLKEAESAVLSAERLQALIQAANTPRKGDGPTAAELVDRLQHKRGAADEATQQYMRRFGPDALRELARQDPVQAAARWRDAGRAFEALLSGDGAAASPESVSVWSSVLNAALAEVNAVHALLDGQVAASTLQTFVAHPRAQSHWKALSRVYVVGLRCCAAWRKHCGPNSADASRAEEALLRGWDRLIQRGIPLERTRVTFKFDEPLCAVCGTHMLANKASAVLSSSKEGFGAMQGANNVVTYEELQHNSAVFPLDMPTKGNRVERLVEIGAATRDEVAQLATGTRVIVLGRVRQLMEDFLALKRETGTVLEQSLYADMTLAQFVTRLFVCRPFVFINSNDMHMRRDGFGSAGGFDAIGSDTQSEKLPLSDYITYDEMAIGALLGVSCPTIFINNGSRDNRGRPSEPGTFERDGVYCGMVGARFERYCRMESVFCFVDKDSTAANAWAPYGQQCDRGSPRARLMALWARFYGLKSDVFPSFQEAQQDPSFVKLPSGGMFNVELYKARMRVSIDTFLLEANARAAAAGKRAYVVQVGLGLGMWMKSKKQTDWLVEAHADALRALALPHVGAINFCWFPPLVDANGNGGLSNGVVIKTATNNIRVIFSKSDPATKLTGENAGMLLVAAFAWDSNSYVGNEYWGGQLTASGDPAAASCCTIMQMMNPQVNPNVSGRTLTLVDQQKQ